MPLIHNIKVIFLGIVLFLSMPLCMSIFTLHAFDLFGKENFSTYIVLFVGNALLIGGGVYWGDRFSKAEDRKELEDFERLEDFRKQKELNESRMTPAEIAEAKRIESSMLEWIKSQEKKP